MPSVLQFCLPGWVKSHQKKPMKPSSFPMVNPLASRKIAMENHNLEWMFPSKNRDFPVRYVTNYIKLPG